MDKLRSTKGWQRVLILIIPYIIIAGVFEWLGFVVAGLDIMHPPLIQNMFQITVTTLFALMGTLLAIWICRRYADKRSFYSLGFNPAYFKIDVTFGIIMGAIIMISGLLLLVVFRQVGISGFDFELSGFLLSVFFYIFVAFSEETLIRGYVLTNLIESFNKYIALFVSAIIFSLMHGGNPNIGLLPLANLLLAGILLGMSFIYTKNLWFPIALHFSWNFFQGAVCGFRVSGIDLYSITQLSYKQDSIWNGGQFGFEGSVICLVMQVAAILIVHKVYSRREEISAQENTPEASTEIS